MNTFKNVPIGEVLKEYGYITDEQIQEALVYQKEHKGLRLGGALMEMGFITERQMLEALGQRLGLSVVDMGTTTVDGASVGIIPQQLAQKYNMLAVAQSDHMLTVVTNDPLNFYGLEDVRQTIGMELDIQLCEEEQVRKAIQYYYSEVEARKAAKSANTSVAGQVEELEVEEGEGDTPIIKLLNSLIQRAYNTSASDIHIEPFENHSLVRMRVDGTIIDYVTLQKALHSSLIARIKILSDLDIAERRVPQDGHFRLKVGQEYVNLRVSVIPTVFGEKAVLRLLAGGNTSIDHIGHYGMIDEDYEKFAGILHSPNGIIYITGPTGSGKTTTLYMVLEELAKRQVNISTIEDPVEKNLPRVNQMQTNQLAGLTFEVGLRALLRQDPDIIMVGETRDSETAAISIRAAITGHLVVSTLHTNNAAASIVRLIDMGMEPYMIASSLVGVVAQRLMRKVCPHCCEERETTEDEAKMIGEHIKIRVPKGCHRCNYTGYRGRIGIHEILLIDKEIKKMISDHASVEEIITYAREYQHMNTLAERATQLVKEGVTTMEELIKIAYYS
ncbi:MAG: GspE/PulE family protein [Clostridia bacterium]|nr:GspE/PulE family protein [Clostridia bacterium]NCC43834.1 GspE/PulE family protein [Clostridia bacterium]